jgi:hypothetical protein
VKSKAWHVSSPIRKDSLIEKAVSKTERQISERIINSAAEYSSLRV